MRAGPHKRLGDLFVFKNGRAFKKEEWSTEGLPIIRIQNLNSRDAPFNYFAGEYSKDILVEEGDLLFSWSGTVGSSFGPHIWDRDPGVLNQHIFKIGFKDDIDRRYAFHALRHITAAIEGSVSGAVGLVHITKEKLHDFTLPVPRLPEQQRIVGVLDEAFSSLATAQAHAEKSLQNAHALFESHLQFVFSQRGKGRVERKLSDVCAITSVLVDPRKEEFLDLTHVGAGNIESRTGAFLDLKTAREEKLISGKFLFDETMVLYSKIRPYLMKVARPDFNGLCSADMYPLAPVPNTVTRDYLFHLLLSRGFTEYAIQGSARAGMPKVNRDHLFGFKFLLPDLNTQKKLAANLDTLASETQRLEGLYQQKQTALVELKKSLLHQVFSGKLTHKLRESKIIPFPITILGITKTDLHAGILAMAYRSHERNGKQADFGHVKGEKIIHLVEALVGADLGRMPVKDAAGPNDFPHLQKVEHRAKMAGYFLFQRVEGAAYRVKKYPKFDELISRTESVLGKHRAEVDRLLELMWPMTSRQAEIFATVFAAWNNLLIDHEPISDERIVQEARENWHPDKLRIPREKFFRAIAWMKEKGICPEGKGKKVLNRGTKRGR